MSIVTRIDSILQEREMSRRQLAISAGLPPSSLQSAMERGKNMTVEMLMAVAKVLDVSPTYLLGFDDIIVRPERYSPAELDELRADYLKLYQDHIEELQSPHGRLNTALKKLNYMGWQKAVDAVEILAKVPEFQAEDDDT